MDYHGAKEEHILRYLTISQRDKRPEERQPLGTGIQAFVFFVASPFTYTRYARGLRLKYKRLYLPSNAQVIFNRALRVQNLHLNTIVCYFQHIRWVITQDDGWGDCWMTRCRGGCFRLRKDAATWQDGVTGRIGPFPFRPWERRSPDRLFSFPLPV